METYIKKEVIKEEGTFGNREKVVLDFEEMFYDWFNSLNQDHQRVVLQSLSLNHSVEMALLERLAEPSDVWSSEDGKLMISLLGKVEQHLVSRLQWSALHDLDSELEQYIKDNRYSKVLYWKMYHDEQHWEFFRKWLETNGFDSNYRTKIADDKLCEVKKIIEKYLNRLTAKLQITNNN
jgi:hypothetical protein